MRKTHLIELLSRLSSKQMRELNDFINSPFFNKNESVGKLFEYLRVNHPDFKEEKTDKEYIYKTLFSPLEYNDGFMRMIIFKLTEVTEQYLAYSNMKNSGKNEKLHLISSLLELGMDKGAGRIIKNTEKLQEVTEIENGEYFYTKYSLEKFKDIIYSRTYRPLTIKDKPDETLLEESNNLTSYFLISILQRYRYLLNKSFTVNISYEPDFLPGILRFLENEGKHYLKTKLIMLLYKQIVLLRDNSREDILKELKMELCSNSIPIEDSERREGLTVIVNLCIEKGYSGREEFYRYILDIDKYLISKNLYNRVHGGYFENEMFMNVVTLGLRLGEIDWIKEFIESNYEKLSPDSRESVYNYTSSKLYLKTGDLEKAQNYIAKVNYTDLHLKINARITSIMIQYESGNIEEVFMQIENFRKYIQKDKLISSGHKKISSNFIKYTSAVCKARYSSKVNLKAMETEVKNCDMISNRKWLIEKINELSNRKA